MKRILVALLGSVLTAAYWWIAFMTVYADTLFAGDANPAAQPAPDGEVIWRSAAIIVAAILIYTALAMLWQRATVRFAGVRRH